MLRTSGFVDDVMFNYDGPYAGMSIALQPRCCHVRRAQVNAPAARCRSHRILNHVLKGQTVKITKNGAILTQKFMHQTIRLNVISE